MIEKNIEFYSGNGKQCDRKKEIEKILKFENDEIISVPLRICRQSSILYAAVEITDKKTEEKSVVCKIFETKTNLKWNNIFSYSEYDEKNCPFYTCPSSILKKLSKTADPKTIEWRRSCKDTLESLAVEKLDSSSLTNLPIGSRIKLMDEDEIILVKDSYSQYSYPIWVNENTDEKYKIKDIQEKGYQIIERGN